MYCISALEIVNMALLVCAVTPQLIHVSDTPLETLSWCSIFENGTKDKRGAAANCGRSSFVVCI